MTTLLQIVALVIKMLISRGYWPSFWHCASPAEDRAFAHCRHLMTVILNTHRTLFCFVFIHITMKFWEAHIYQSRRGSSCSQVFGLASTVRLTNCLWIASSKAPSTPFCHRLLTNALRLPLPDTCLLPTFCSLLSDGLLCILARLTMSGCISAAAGSPVSHSAVPHSPLSSASISPNAFFPFGFGVGIYLQKLHSFSKFSQNACFFPPTSAMLWSQHTLHVGVILYQLLLSQHSFNDFSSIHSVIFNLYSAFYNNKLSRGALQR